MLKTTPPSRLTPALVFIAGLATLNVTLAFSRLPQVLAAGTCWASDAILRFEFATTQADLVRIFGEAGGACRALNLTAMDAANTLDVFIYIPSYTAFAVLAALFIAGRAQPRLRTAAIALAGLACVADYVETLTLLSITQHLETAAPAEMLRACVSAWIKFAALALHALVLSLACFRDNRRILGVLLIAPTLGLAAMAVSLDLSNALKLGLTLAWTPLLLIGAKETLWPRRVGAREAA